MCGYGSPGSSQSSDSIGKVRETVQSVDLSARADALVSAALKDTVLRFESGWDTGVIRT